MYKPNIIRGDAQAFEDIIYGPPQQHLAQYIGASMKTLSGYITDKTRSFFNNAQSIYNQFTGEQARQRIYRNILNNNIYISGDTLSLITEDNYSNLSNVNKRYLMVDPELFKMKLKNTIGAFGDVYEDRDSYLTDVHWKRDYLEVERGLVQFKDDKAIYTTTADNNSNLTLSEQLIIKNNWAVAKRLMADDIDITENII